MDPTLYLKIRRNKVKDFNNLIKDVLTHFPNLAIYSLSITDKNNKPLKEMPFKNTSYSIEEIENIIFDSMWGVITLKGSFVQDNRSETVTISRRILNSEGDVLYSYPSIIWESEEGSCIHFEKNKDLQETFFKVVRKIIENINPDIVLVTQENIPEIASWFEYYKNPYFFCIEPIYRTSAVIDDTDTAFLENQEILRLLSNFKSIIEEEELFSILRSKCSGVVKIGDGVGIFRAPEKEIGGGSYKSYVYPRYFIRKELRARGIELKEGLAEKYAKELGIE